MNAKAKLGVNSVGRKLADHSMLSSQCDMFDVVCASRSTTGVNPPSLQFLCLSPILPQCASSGLGSDAADLLLEHQTIPVCTG